MKSLLLIVAPFPICSLFILCTKVHFLCVFPSTQLPSSQRQGSVITELQSLDVVKMLNYCSVSTIHRSCTIPLSLAQTLNTIHWHSYRKKSFLRLSQYILYTNFNQINIHVILYLSLQYIFIFQYTSVNFVH